MEEFKMSKTEKEVFVVEGIYISSTIRREFPVQVFSSFESAREYSRKKAEEKGDILDGMGTVNRGYISTVVVVDPEEGFYIWTVTPRMLDKEYV